MNDPVSHRPPLAPREIAKLLAFGFIAACAYLLACWGLACLAVSIGAN